MSKFAGFICGVAYLVLAYLAFFYRVPPMWGLGIISIIFSTLGWYVLFSSFRHDREERARDEKLVEVHIYYLGWRVYTTFFDKDCPVDDNDWLREHTLQQFVDDDRVEVKVKVRK